MIEAIERAGLQPGRDIFIAIDVAASSLKGSAPGSYRLEREGRRASGEAAALLPALLLARVDGKSPVEYLRDETGREAVRRFAGPLIVSPPHELGEIAAKWKLARATRA